MELKRLDDKAKAELLKGGRAFVVSRRGSITGVVNNADDPYEISGVYLDPKDAEMRVNEELDLEIARFSDWIEDEIDPEAVVRTRDGFNLKVEFYVGETAITWRIDSWILQ